MYIQPNTTLRLIRNVALDNTYENTLYFYSESEQIEYFSRKAKYVHNNLTYQRHSNGVIMLQRKAEDLFDCNYLMFQNTSFGNKWFYAFINKVEYVDNITCRIEFEIDEMQTWFFDYTLNECFVEREHSVDDTLGENILEEGLPLGDILTVDVDRPEMFNNWSCVVASTYSKQGISTNGANIYSGVWSGVNYLMFSTVAELNTYLDELYDPETESNINGVVAMYMYPTEFSISGTSIPTNLISKEYIYPIKELRIGNELPRNNKLQSYPYNYFQVTDFGTNVVDYRYEFFRTGDTVKNVTFSICGEASPNTEFMCIPEYYQSNEQENVAHACRTAGFPMCSMNVDSYKSWLAQNKASLQSGIITNAMSSGLSGAITGSAGGVGGAILGGVVGASFSVLNGVSEVMKTSEQMKHAPDTVTGKLGSGLNIAKNLLGFCFLHKTISQEYAQMIDDYFTMFGYATRKVKVPNRNSRPYFNYVKTVVCNITGECPAETVSKIKAIYNRGITFWKNGDTVGNYSLDNRP